MFNFSCARKCFARKLYHAKMTMQDEIINAESLRHKGNTVSSAARKIKRSTAHVFRVITGERESRAVVADLKKLPTRPYIPRERVVAAR